MKRREKERRSSSSSSSSSPSSPYVGIIGWIVAEADINHMSLVNLESGIGIQRRRNCIYDRKFYVSVVDLLVNFGNVGMS